MMLPYNYPVFAEIKSFLEACTGGKLEVYNTGAMLESPDDEERIEFKLDSFCSTGQIYQKSTDDPSGMVQKSIAEYRCELVIRVIEDAINSGFTTNQITGAVQTNAFVDNYIKSMYLINNGMYIDTFRVQRDNVIYNFSEIIIPCYIGIDFSINIDYFTKVVGTEFNVDNDKDIIDDIELGGNE